MATSQQRELMAQVEELGYTYKGRDKSNAVIMWHPTAGSLRIHATPSDNRYALNKMSEARRKLRLGETRYGQFMDWLLQKYGVGKTGQKEMRLSVREEAREYLDSHPEGGRLESLVAMLDQDPRLEVLDRKQGQKTWGVRMTGLDYGTEDILTDDAPVVHLSPQANNHEPMETVLDTLRNMMMAEMNGELEDLRAKHDLTVSTLSDLLAALKDAPRVEA
jgi:hypothetical protein